MSLKPRGLVKSNPDSYPHLDMQSTVCYTRPDGKKRSDYIGY